MKKVDIIRIRYMIYCIFKRTGYDHAKFLKKHNVFHGMGENCFFQPWNVSADSQYVRFGNNVVIASGMEFICHDVIDAMLNHSENMEETLNSPYRRYWGTIDIGNNVFIGAGVKLLPNTRIGNNVIVAAGAVVNGDVPDGVVVGGIPAKVIGNVEDLKKKRLEYSETQFAQMGRSERICYLWNQRDGRSEG